MNDERSFYPYPELPEPATTERASELRASHDDELAAGPSVLIGGDTRNTHWLERICAMAGASKVDTVTDATILANRRCELRPDLIIIDLDTTTTCAPDLLVALREGLPDRGFLPIVVLTIDTSPRNRDRALAAGATDVVTKPYDDVELVERIINLLTMRALYRHVQQCNHIADVMPTAPAPATQQSGHETLA